MLAMSKTFVAVFHHHQRNPHRGTPRRAPMTGFFGTDFWHAVEFSRNGRAPVRVSRPVVGQPIHAMSAAAPLSKRIRGCHSAPRTCDREGHRAPGVSTARPLNASGSPWSAYESTNARGARQIPAGAGKVSVRRRCRRRPGCAGRAAERAIARAATRQLPGPSPGPRPAGCSRTPRPPRPSAVPPTGSEPDR
jgi:hypothetical protein